MTAQLLASTPLVVREPGSGTREALEQALHTALQGARLATPAMQLSSSSSVRATIAAGVAPGALSDLAVADDLARGRLVTVEVAGIDLRRKLRAVWCDGARPPAGPVRDLIAIAAADA